jgi:hypothetical protein
MTIRFTPMYEVKETIRSIDDLRSIFPDGKADLRNWCFFGTSGVHGSYTTIDDLDDPAEDETADRPYLTVLVVQPRACVILCGNILAHPEDRPWLRTLAASTLRAVAESQEGNLP